MEKKSFIQKLKNMGPAAIIASAFIGPGTITTSTISGTNFQYALLWAVVFSGIASISLLKYISVKGRFGGRGTDVDLIFDGGTMTYTQTADEFTEYKGRIPFDEPGRGKTKQMRF